MAKASAMFFNSMMFLAAVLSLFLVVSTVESRLLEGVVEPVAATPTCNTVYGVESGDTCFDIAEKFSLSTQVFESINPNLVCNTLFAGQWICISGKP